MATMEPGKEIDKTSGKSFDIYMYQERARSFYNTKTVQVGVAVLICVNFIANIIEKEIDPDGTKHTSVFLALEYTFNILFLLELVVNMYGHWFKLFWRDGWNWFDFVVVTIGVVMMLKLPLPNSFNVLRMMRAFRVFRLFRRVKSLNKILVAIILAVPGVLNAFLILTIVMCIYAILGVEFFKDVGDGCKIPSMGLTSDLETNRRNCLGREYFGTFSKSLFSFFQVMTAESWSEVIARPIFESYESPWVALGSAIYFVSFVLITGMVLVNVVVAVLLDKMVDPEVDVEGICDEDEEVSATVEGALQNHDATATAVAAAVACATLRSSVSFEDGADSEERSSAQPDAQWAPSATRLARISVSSAHQNQDHRHSNTLHGRMSDIERQLRDMRRSQADMLNDFGIIQGLLGHLRDAVQADRPAGTANHINE